jgi:hypothetical protein
VQGNASGGDGADSLNIPDLAGGRSAFNDNCLEPDGSY